jgi:hypothetical protein
VPRRAIFRENLPNGGRGFPGELKKAGGYAVALTAVAFDTSSDHIGSFISTTFRDGYQVIHSISLLPAVMASEVIAL